MTGVLIVAGCGKPEPREAEFANQLTDAGVVDDVALAGDVSATAGSLTGIWALATDWSTCVTIGAAHFELRTYKLARVQIVQQGYVLHETRKVCSVVNTALLGQVTAFPPTLVQNYPSVICDSSISGVDVGAQYQSGLDVQVFGAKLSNPALDPLPTGQSDPRIVDVDGDGHPGGTLVVGAMCEVYVVNRATSSERGELVVPGRLEGDAIQDAEQVVLGGTSAFCQQTFVSKPNQAHNHFVLQKLEGLGLDSNGDGDVDCAEIAAAQTQIITWRSADAGRCAAGPP